MTQILKGALKGQKGQCIASFTTQRPHVDWQTGHKLDKQDMKRLIGKPAMNPSNPSRKGRQQRGHIGANWAKDCLIYASNASDGKWQSRQKQDKQATQ